MRAVVFGCGSAGRRHAAALTDHGDVGSVVLVSAWEGCAHAVTGLAGVEVVHPDAAPAGDVAVIANDTARHVSTALPLVRQGMHVLIEKPISHTLEGLDALQAAARESGARVFAAYNLRFLGAIAHLRELLRDGGLGEVWFARFEAGQWLPDWRPGRDYRDTYSASRARGGGVGLDLSHEVDVMRFLLGDALALNVAKRRVSDLKIDSEDLLEGLYELAGGALASVHLDYLSPTRRRAYRIVGSRGEAVCDVANAELVTVVDGERTVADDPALFDVAATYPAQIDAFIAAAGGARTALATLDDGIKALELVEAPHA